MITQRMLLDALNDITAQCFPKRTTYRDAWPEQFVRPSIFLVAEPRAEIGGNRHLIEYKQVLAAQLNDTVDAHYEADTDRLCDETDQLMEMLSQGYLSVSDRALHIDAIETEREGTASLVKITLHWFDDRPQHSTTYPMMKEFNLETEIQEGGV